MVTNDGESEAKGQKNEEIDDEYEGGHRWIIEERRATGSLVSCARDYIQFNRVSMSSLDLQVSRRFPQTSLYRA